MPSLPWEACDCEKSFNHLCSVAVSFIKNLWLSNQRTRARGFFDMANVERSVRSEKPFGRTVWGLLSLELWFRQFFDGR